MKNLFVLFGFLALFLPSVAEAQMCSGSPHPACQEMDIQVDLSAHGIPGPSYMRAEFCVPPGNSRPTPTTIDFFVHGSSYNRHYWDFPLMSQHYSMTDNAIEHGHATLAVDRIGTGDSTLPPSFLVGLEVVLDSLHQTLQQIRDGRFGAYDTVVYHGNSLTSAYGWVLASRHPEDIDLLVSTGLSHFTRPSFLGLVQSGTRPATDDERFADLPGIDPGYLAVLPGLRDEMFIHAPNAHPRVLVQDEMLTDIVSARLIGESLPLVWSPPDSPHPFHALDPANDPAQGVMVPVLFVIGEFDNTTCGGPDGYPCDVATIAALEAPYWNPNNQPEIHVVPNTGHALNLHYSGPSTMEMILDWIDARD